jgi:hypothetical protein
MLSLCLLVGKSQDLFDQFYSRSCAAALEHFCNKFWPCSYVSRKNRACVNVKATHSAKGHQTAEGRIISSGPYESQFSSFNYSSTWTTLIKEYLFRSEKQLEDGAAKERPRPRTAVNPKDVLAYDLHHNRVQVLFKSVGKLHSGSLCEPHNIFSLPYGSPPTSTSVRACFVNRVRQGLWQVKRPQLVCDGALSIRVANHERKCLWPDVAENPPDIILSVGTGKNDSVTAEELLRERTEQSIVRESKPKSNSKWNRFREKLNSSKPRKPKPFQLVSNYFDVLASFIRCIGACSVLFWGLSPSLTAAGEQN